MVETMPVDGISVGMETSDLGRRKYHVVVALTGDCVAIVCSGGGLVEVANLVDGQGFRSCPITWRRRS